jgi:hypothetical protein
MPNTMTLISSSTVGLLGASSIDFTSIPSTYTDLVIKGSLRLTTAAVNETLYLTINGSTANGSFRQVLGAGTGFGSGTDSRVGARDINGSTSTSSTFSNTEFYIPNYAGGAAKSFSADSVAENNASVGIDGLTASLWNQTAAITSISLVGASGSFVQYSTAYLYGVKNA